MDADRRPGQVGGLIVFVGSIGALFLIARFTHFVFMVIKDPDRFSAATIAQGALIAAGVLLVGGIVAAARLLLARHDPHHHGPVGHFSGRAA
ncbi:hypothetical protein [Rhodoplanes azumiensis]|uniref:Uncharacterized protein n=1 Tax=Rhodoplanes azumiensis TaxID=1897628 RepID=A0ABW5AIP6_9BRAD